MFVIDSRDTLSFALEHAARLRKEAAPKQKRPTPVAWLRRHACRCRIDTAPLAHRSA